MLKRLVSIYPEKYSEYVKGEFLLPKRHTQSQKVADLKVSRICEICRVGNMSVLCLRIFMDIAHGIVGSSRD